MNTVDAREQRADLTISTPERLNEYRGPDIFIATAKDLDPEDFQKAKSLRVMEVFPKPFNSDALITKVAESLNSVPNQNTSPSIVIVDDDPDGRRLIALFLSNAIRGVIVHQFFSPQTAFEKIKEIKPNIVITDIMLPEMSGWELTEKIQEWKKALVSRNS